jgi:hypothetical protein
MPLDTPIQISSSNISNTSSLINMAPTLKLLPNTVLTLKLHQLQMQVSMQTINPVKMNPCYMRTIHSKSSANVRIG